MKTRKPAAKAPPETSLARYDWTKARRGRYAARFPRTAHLVVIDPALYEHFGSAAAVNEALALVVKIRQLGRPRRSKHKRAAA